MKLSLIFILTAMVSSLSFAETIAKTSDKVLFETLLSIEKENASLITRLEKKNVSVENDTLITLSIGTKANKLTCSLWYSETGDDPNYNCNATKTIKLPEAF